jgi:hypothetical protein
MRVRAGTKGDNANLKSSANEPVQLIARLGGQPICDDPHTSHFTYMASHIMNDKSSRPRGTVSVLRSDGSHSDIGLHEEMMAGVDDSDIRMRTRQTFLARGVPVEVLDRVLPEGPSK